MTAPHPFDPPWDPRPNRGRLLSPALFISGAEEHDVALVLALDGWADTVDLTVGSQGLSHVLRLRGHHSDLVVRVITFFGCPYIRTVVDSPDVRTRVFGPQLHPYSRYQHFQATEFLSSLGFTVVAFPHEEAEQL